MKNLIFLRSPLIVLLTLFIINAEDGKKLTYDQVYNESEPQLTSKLSSIEGWLNDTTYLMLKKDTANNAKKLYKVDVMSGREKLFIDPQNYTTPFPEDIDFWDYEDRTDDYQKMLYEYDNDIYCLDTGKNTFKRLTANRSKENNPTFSPDEQKIAFTRNRDLYTLDLGSGLEYRLTYDAAESVYNGYAAYVYYEEILGRDSDYRAFYWSPDSKQLAFLRFDESQVPEFPIFRSNGKHGELEVEHYPKAGDPIPKVQLGIVAANSDSIIWADFDKSAEQYLAAVNWLENGKLSCQWMNRDQNKLKIYEIDRESGAKKLIYEEEQESWVDFIDDLYWLNDKNAYLILTDKKGWNHLYIYNTQGQLEKRLTKGEWRVRNIEMVDPDDNYIYFTASKEKSTEVDLYRKNISGWHKKIEKLTDQPGYHQIDLSTDGNYYLDTFSNINRPKNRLLCDNSGNIIRKVGTSKNPVMEQYDLGKIELFRVAIGNGYQLPVKWVLPPNFDKSKKYPVIFDVYGGPDAATVYNSFPRHLENFFLAQQGAIVIKVDHRGSGHFGKKGVAEMHRNLGKWEMHDWIEVAKWLRKKGFVDPDRIAIKGGSYGGYVTLMALTYGHEYFTHGISQFPVARWVLYDAIYTERYMDEPQDNPEGYKFGSALTHAHKFNGKLLLIHSTMDDNVHMQNTFQMINKFTELNKHFELMIYPGERHGIRDEDKEKHLDRLMFNWWNDKFFMD